MDTPLIWIVPLLVAGAAALFCYRAAESKGRSSVGFAILGFILPLVGVVAVLVVGPRTTVTT